MAPGFGVGDRGDPVSEIQQHLVALGFDPGPVDGIFGPKTAGAVEQFQRRHHVTGTVDAHTRAKLTEMAIAERRRQAMQVEVPSGLAELEATFGRIEYEEAEGGYIVITNDWADHNLNTMRLPVVGKTVIHAKLVPVFRNVFSAIDAAGLGDEIKQFGVWSPRHKMHDPKRGLSTHSWAIACDINWATNPVGRVGDISPDVVKIFEAAGFNWGGRWKHRDDMHFQYCRHY